MKKEIKYTWNETDNEYWDHDILDSVEACIEDATEYGITDSIFIGEVEPYEIYVDADSILEYLEEIAYNECGEAAECWLPSHDIDQEDINMLSVKLTNVIKGWLRERNAYPKFFNVVNIREVDIY